MALQNTWRPPAQPESYCESKQTYFSYCLNKAFHLPEFWAKLFFFTKLSGRFLLRQPLNIVLVEHMLTCLQGVSLPVFTIKI